MANTPNFSLYKPNRADNNVDVDTSLADNFTKIDTELQNNKGGLAAHISDPNAHTSENVSHADGSVKTTLENHEERLTAGEVASADHEERISSNETELADHETRIGDVETSTSAIDARVTDIEVLGIDKLAPNLEGRITTLESDIEGHLAPATFEALSQQNYTFDDLRMGYVDSKLADIAIQVGAKNTSETDDTSRLQRAIDKARDSGTKRVLLEGITYTISNKITLYEHIILEGQGQEKTIIDCSYSGFAFEYITGNGFSEKQAPHFKYLKIVANNGIKLNDIGNGFSDSGSTQEYIMRPLIEDCTIEAKVQGSGIGVQWSKCFDGHIWRSKIFNFSINVDLHGSDICSIKHNRLIGSSIAEIRLTSYNTFGSQTLIQHNDVLSPSGGSFIISSDRAVRIKDNYFEGFGTLERVLKILTGTTEAIIKDNRVEVGSSVAPYWLEIQAPLFNLVVENNVTSGDEMGDVYFPNGYKWYSGIKRAKVSHKGNTNSKGLPFNSIDSPVFSGKTAFIGSPHLDGLQSSDYGLSVKVQEESFAIPAIANYASMIAFLTKTYGSVNIGIVAKSTVDQQRVSFQRLDGTSVIDTSNTLVGTDFKYYPLWSNVSVNDLQLKFWNDDTVKNGNVLIKKIIVEWA